MTPEQLLTWRTKNGYTQKQLAEMLGVTNIAVYRWESGVRKIPSFLHLALTALEMKGKSKKERR